jgi:hypothetical protein
MKMPWDCIGVRICNKCCKPRSIGDFRFRLLTCKYCEKHIREPNESRTECQKRRNREYYVNNREAILKHMRNTRDPIRARSYFLLSTYGLTLDTYNEMLSQQDYCCAICHLPFTENNRPGIDHDHNTGAVRGILHSTCNMGIGLLRDDPDVLYNALEYLVEKKG